MVDFNQYLAAFGQVPWKLILYLGLEFGVAGGGIVIWFFRVFRHPIALHVQLERAAGKPWVKMGGRIVQNEDGTRYLKILGRKDPMPAPDLKYVHSNRTMFLFRPLRIYMKEDGQGALHPFDVQGFNSVFIPEDINSKFFYINMRRRAEEMYNPTKQWLLNNFGTIVSTVTIVLAVVMLVIMSGNMKDVYVHASDVLGNAINNFASAISTQGAPPVG